MVTTDMELGGKVTTNKQPEKEMQKQTNKKENVNKSTKYCVMETKVESE